MLFRLILACALTLPTFALDDDWYERRDRRGGDRGWSRNDRASRSQREWEQNRRRNNGYGYEYGQHRYGFGVNRGGYGYGNNSGYAMVNRTLQDLQSAAARNRVDGHERDHFNRAIANSKIWGTAADQ